MILRKGIVFDVLRSAKPLVIIPFPGLGGFWIYLKVLAAKFTFVDYGNPDLDLGSTSTGANA
jgi:hypothetical protein